MIRALFLPDAIGSYYLFLQRVVAFEITKTHVYATVVKLYQRKKTIEKCLVHEIGSPTDEHSHAALTSVAIKALLKEIQHYTHVVTTISSNLVNTKELTLPFTDIAKIKMVAPFEIEGALPFTLQDAIVDCLIVEQEATQARVLVAATQKKYIDEINALFAAAGVIPDRISVDLFELFGLFLSIPDYAQLTDPVVLVHPQGVSTRVMLTHNGKLISMRVLNNGVHNQTAFLKDLALTIEGFKTHYTYDIAKIIALIASESPLIEAIHTATDIPTEACIMSKIAHNMNITIASHVHIAPEYSISLATALSSSFTAHFNMQISSVTTDESLLIRQLMVTAVLTLLILGSFMLHSFFTVRTLRKELMNSEKETVTLLKKELNLPPSKTSLGELIKQAQSEIDKRARVWYQLSPQSRHSLLVYMQELSTCLNREELGLNMKKLTINEDTATMKLEGSVKNWEALRTLETALSSCPLFKNVSKLHELNFIATITLEKNEESL